MGREKAQLEERSREVNTNILKMQQILNWWN